MQIVEVLQSFVCQAYRRGGLFAALKIAWKVHNFISLLKNLHSFLPLFQLKTLQKQVTYVPSAKISAQEPLPPPTGEKEIRDLKEIKVELLPFYDTEEEITPFKVKEFFETFNQRYFNYFIDPKEDLLIGIRTRKLQMIIKGEDAYIQEIEDKARQFKPGFQVYIILNAREKDPLVQKIKHYSEDRIAMRHDLPYQRKMLGYFVEWYTRVTELPSLPASAAHYIT